MFFKINYIVWTTKIRKVLAPGNLTIYVIKHISFFPLHSGRTRRADSLPAAHKCTILISALVIDTAGE